MTRASSSTYANFSSTNITNPHHFKKPTNKPIVSPSKKSTTKPVYKYPTKKPLNLQPPTVRPIYKYPTKIPSYHYPSKKPTVKPTKQTTFTPTVIPAIKPSVAPSFGPTVQPNSPSAVPTFRPSFEPTSSPIVAWCSCTHYQDLNGGQNIVACWNVTKSNEFYGIYSASDVSFSYNEIINNPNFPGNSTLANCDGHSYNNAHPFDSYGAAYSSTGTTYRIVYLNSQLYISQCGVNGYNNLSTIGSVSCTYDIQEIGSLQGTSETELTINTDLKITIGVVVSVILVSLCVIVMFLHRKYKTNNNVETNKDDDLDIFYTINNNDENKHCSNNPMNIVSS